VTPTNLSRIYIRIHIQDGLFALINSEPEKEDLDLAKNIKAAKVMRVAHLPCPLRRLWSYPPLTSTQISVLGKAEMKAEKIAVSRAAKKTRIEAPTGGAAAASAAEAAAIAQGANKTWAILYFKNFNGFECGHGTLCMLTYLCVAYP
jgi:hypothetical protein